MAKTAALTPPEIADRLKALPGWRLEGGASGVTASDMELAGLIEQTALWRPRPGASALRGTTRKFVSS